MSGQPFRARFGFDADGNRLMELADPAALDDAVNLRTLRSSAGFGVVGRAGNLPTDTDPNPLNRPIPGRAYLVKQDVAGNPLGRVFVWDGNAGNTGGLGVVTADLDPADAALVTANAGVADPGIVFTAGRGNGGQVALTAQANGQLGVAVTAAGTGYEVGQTMTLAAGSLGWANTQPVVLRVQRLAGAQPYGAWQSISLKDWIKTTAAAADHATGQEPGDLQLTTESNNEELKVWDGNSWVTIYSTAATAAKIAALSLFEGTAKQVGGAAVPGAVAIDALPDLTSTNPADATAAAAKASHYWTWTGTAGYVVQAGDPNGLGRDLAGATMQVGDWLQLVNRAAAGAPADMHWVHIGGDLLARSRADQLYGAQAWRVGNYEQGSIVNHDGSLWRATSGVLPTDVAPGQSGPRSTVTIQLPASAPAAGRSYSVVVTVGGVASAPQVFAVAAADDTAATVPKLAAWFTATFPTVFGATVPGAADTLTVTARALNAVLAVALTGTGIGAPLANTVANTNTAAPWGRIPLNAGVRSVTADGNLPASAPPADVYLVLQSARAGGKPALYSFDAAAAQWLPLGGQGNPIDWTTGVPVYNVGCPIGAILMWPAAAPPPGWLVCDGTVINATLYPKLVAVVGANLPDLRGQFVRGAGPRTGAIGSRHGYTTARPNTAFTGSTNTAGVHTHGLWSRRMNAYSGAGYSPAAQTVGEGIDARGTTNVSGRWMDSDGDHSHTTTVTGGGDAETAPDHVVLAYIIKATDNGLRL